MSAAQVDESRWAISACFICGHRAIWHHDERGCQYLGNIAERRCACRRNSDQVVARLIHEAMNRAARSWLDASVEGKAPDEPFRPERGDS